MVDKPKSIPDDEITMFVTYSNKEESKKDRRRRFFITAGMWFIVFILIIMEACNALGS